MADSARAFILANTRLQRPSAVPELELYLGTAVFPLWSLLEAESSHAEDALPYWAFAWPGGQALARYVLDRPAEVRGRRVMDFAAGSGICGLAAAKVGAADVIAVDVDPYSAAAVSLNAGANGLFFTFVQDDVLDREVPPVDCVLAGDICYDAMLSARALRWLRNAHAAGIRVLLADPGRAHVPREELACLAEYEIATSRELEDAEMKSTGVYTFRAMQTAGMTK